MIFASQFHGLRGRLSVEGRVHMNAIGVALVSRRD